VFDAVTARLRALPPGCLSRMDAEATLTPEALPSMADTVLFLRGLDFRRVCLKFDIFEDWSPERLAGLKRALGALRDRYLSGAASWPREGRLHPNDVLFETNTASRWGDRRSLVLSVDGSFLACHTLEARAPEALRVGDLERGIDLGRLRRIYGSALAALPEDHAYSLYPFLDRYHYARSIRRDPAAMVESGCRAGRLLARAVDGMKAEERVLERLDKDPHFGDFGHEPRYRSKDELASIRLPMGSGLPDELARLRQAADFCLYSPGRGKTLLMVPKDPKASFQLVEGIALYSRLKARKLKKDLSLLLQADASSLSAEQARFLKDHGVLHGFTVLSFGRTDAASLLRRLASAGPLALLALRADGLWSDSELGVLHTMVAEFPRVLRRRPVSLLGPDLAWGHDPRAAQVLADALEAVR
jgi:hypothetical protein